MSDITPGQKWRRKKDGVIVTVLKVSDAWSRTYVTHQTTRRFYTELPNFLKKYELVEEA